MNEKLRTLPVYGRKATQQRSKKTRQKIVRAATQILAEHGLAGLTHRTVAKRAEVSLAATTYYYKTKSDIIADISNYLIDDCIEIVDKTDRQDGFENLVFAFISHICLSDRATVIAWLEIMFGAGRRSEDGAFTRGLPPFIEKAWDEFADTDGDLNASSITQSELDMAIGLFLMILALGLDKQNLISVFVDGVDPFQSWAKAKPNDDGGGLKPNRLTPKAKATRRRILDATIFIIVEQGASAVNFRAVAKHAKLTAAAPAYYFSSVQQLLREAQSEMFEHSKTRYKQTMGAVSYSTMNIDELIDLTTTVFFREATEFGALNLANYGIWLEAARVPELQPMIWTAIEDQALAWYRVLQVLNPQISPLNAFIIQAIYIGKLIRIVCAGALTQDLASVRKEFSSDLRNLVKLNK